MPVYRVIVKGNTSEAFAAAITRGLTPRWLTEHNRNEVHGYVEAHDAGDKLVRWFCEDHEPPFTAGSLLHYTDGNGAQA